MTRVHVTIAIRGRVGEHELLPGPWLEGLHDRLSTEAGGIAVAYTAGDGTTKHAILDPETVRVSDGFLRGEADAADDQLPPPPHGGLSR